jgi:hypothetical protein
MRTLLVAVTLVLLLVAGCGSKRNGQQQGLVVGAVEDAAKWSPNPEQTMAQTRDSGFSAVVLGAVWRRGATADGDVAPLRSAVRAAVASGIRPLIAVYQTSANTPSSPEDRAAFAAYAAGLARALPSVRDVMIGNEPNLNLFWMPQFGADGGDAAAASYEQLLAATYDALKAVSPDISVIGANVAPHGGDDPASTRPTHSPTAFIRDTAAAYKASGRTRPIMDAISVHVYGETSGVPPSFAHPNSTSIGIADYGKLVQLLQAGFDGTAQPGSKLPIVYGEYGVETTVPPDKRSEYTGREIAPTVDPATQAQYYRRAIDLARGQPNVTMLFIFHVFDEQRLEGLQSGVRYVDGSPKPSMQAIQR